MSLMRWILRLLKPRRCNATHALCNGDSAYCTRNAGHCGAHESDAPGHWYVWED